MNSHRVVLASFLGSMAIIVYRDAKDPDASWPLGPVPPPYRFLWAGVAFGICALVADMINDKIGSVIAGGLFLGLAFNVITKSSQGPGANGGAASIPPKSSTPKSSSSPVPGTTPNSNNGVPT